MPAPGLGIPLPLLTAKGSPPSLAPCPELPWDSACGLPGCTLFLPSPRVPASLPQVRTPDTGPQSQGGPAGEAGGRPGQTGPLPRGGQRGRPWPHSLVSSLGHILSLGSRIIASSCPARARGPWDWVGVRHRWQRTRAGKHLDHSLWSARLDGACFSAGTFQTDQTTQRGEQGRRQAWAFKAAVSRGLPSSVGSSRALPLPAK